MFEFDKNQNLLVDDLYFDQRYPSYLFVSIGGVYYKMQTAGHDWKDGRDIAARLRPAPHYSPAETAEKEPNPSIMAMMWCMARKEN